MDHVDADGADQLDRRFVADASIVVRRIGDETLLVPVTSHVGDLDSIYTLTDVGSRIWTWLETPVSLRQIVNLLCAEYDVAAHIASRDTAGFVDALVAKRLARPAVDQGSER